MRRCPICGTRFDDRAFQLSVGRLGPFDSFECLEEAVRRDRRGNLADDLLSAAQPRDRDDDVSPRARERPDEAAR